MNVSDWPALNEAYAWTGGAGIIGRLMYHSRQVQQGKRKPFSIVLLFDLPIALGMGWAALGLAVWLGSPRETTTSLAIAAAYLGPYSVDRLFALLGEKYFGKDPAP